MTLVPCRACSNPVSADAVFCPKCGAQNPAFRNVELSPRVRKVVYAFLLIAAVVALYALMYGECDPYFDSPSWCKYIGRGPYKK